MPSTLSLSCLPSVPVRTSSLYVEDYSSIIDSLGTDGSLSSRPSSGKSDTAPVPLSRLANEKACLISPTPFFDNQPSSVLDEESFQSKVPLCLSIDPLNENYSLNSESLLVSSQMESPMSSKECAPPREHSKSSSSHRVARHPSLRQLQRESTPQPPILFDVFNNFATSDPTDSVDPVLPLQRTEPYPCDVSGEGLVQSDNEDSDEGVLDVFTSVSELNDVALNTDVKEISVRIKKKRSIFDDDEDEDDDLDLQILWVCERVMMCSSHCGKKGARRAEGASKRQEREKGAGYDYASVRHHTVPSPIPDDLSSSWIYGDSVEKATLFPLPEDAREKPSRYSPISASECDVCFIEPLEWIIQEVVDQNKEE